MSQQWSTRSAQSRPAEIFEKLWWTDNVCENCDHYLLWSATWINFPIILRTTIFSAWSEFNWAQNSTVEFAKKEYFYLHFR